MGGDREIWEAYKRVVKASPRRGKVTTALKAEEKTARRQSAETAPPSPPKMNATKLKDDALRALERKRERHLRQGDIEIEAKLDLHGMTQVEAFDALGIFMRKQVKAGTRCLLIVTGKGRGGAGVLRSSLQDWLGQLPEASSVLALRPAAVRHGGTGAFYVLLRKKI